MLSVLPEFVIFTTMLPIKRLAGLCLVILTISKAFVSHADEIKPSHLIDWGHVSEKLQLATRNPSHISIKHLLARSSGVEASRGLIVMGAAQPHEIESARRFADIFHGKFGLQLILLAVHDKRPIPAFDGIIVDSDFNVVANFSLKSLNRPNPVSLTKTVQSGFRKMDEFSLPARWVSLLKENTSWQPKEQNGECDVPQFAEFRSESALEDFTKYNDSMAHLVSIFVGDRSRINWLLADVEDSSNLEVEDIEKASPYLFENPPRVLLVRMNEALALVHSGKMYVEFRRDCERDLVHIQRL